MNHCYDDFLFRKCTLLFAVKLFLNELNRYLRLDIKVSGRRQVKYRHTHSDSHSFFDLKVVDAKNTRE